VDKKRDKLERKVLDSQERAFWDVHRPAVSLSVLSLSVFLCMYLYVFMYVCVAVLSVCRMAQSPLVSLKVTFAV